MTSVAYPLLVLALTGSPTQAGIVAFAQSLPFLVLFLPGGAWVDRWPRRPLMIGCELGRGLALGSVAVVALAAGTDAVTVAHLAGVAFVEGCLFVLFDLAEGAALPHLVPAAQVPTAVAYQQGRTQAADLVGQPLGGVLFSVAPGLPFAVDAVTYVLGGGAIAAIRGRLQGERAPVTTRLRAQIAEGLRFVARDRFLRETVGLIGGINLAFNALTLVLIVRAADLGASPSEIGVMLGMYGAGGLAGALLSARLHAAIPGRTILVGVAWLWAALTAASCWRPPRSGSAWSRAATAFPGPVYNVVVAAATYRITPEHMLGRVRSTAKLVAWGTIPLAGLLGGLLAEHLGAAEGILGLAALLLAMALLATASPGLRTLSGNSLAPQAVSRSSSVTGRRRRRSGQSPAPEEQARRGDLGQRVGEAASEVQPGGVVALPEPPPRRDGQFRLLAVDRRDLHAEALGQQTQVGGSAGSLPGFDDDAHLDRRHGAHQQVADVRHHDLRERLRVGLTEDDGGDGGGVEDDRHRGRPCTS